MKILVDMNLSPGWVEVLAAAGWESTHWSRVGAPDATDAVIMEWALRNNHIVFTHDLDFGAILAATRAAGPSVIQVRTENVLPANLADTVVNAIRRFRVELEQGALISVEPDRARARILPLAR